MRGLKTRHARRFFLERFGHRYRQADLARLLGMEPNTWARIERGELPVNGTVAMCVEYLARLIKYGLITQDVAPSATEYKTAVRRTALAHANERQIDIDRLWNRRDDGSELNWIRIVADYDPSTWLPLDRDIPPLPKRIRFITEELTGKAWAIEDAAETFGYTVREWQKMERGKVAVKAHQVAAFRFFLVNLFFQAQYESFEQFRQDHPWLRINPVGFGETLRLAGQDATPKKLYVRTK